MMSLLRLVAIASLAITATATQTIANLDAGPHAHAAPGLATGDPSHPYSDPVWFPLRNPARVSCAKTNCEGPYHGFDAIDWIGERGDPVFASGAGIFRVGAIDPGCRAGETTFGTWGWIDHGPAGISRYTHLDTIVASDGQLVTPATQIGTMGSSGDQSPCQTNYLHWEIRAGESVDSRLPVPNFRACVNGRTIQLPEALGYATWDDVPPQIVSTPSTDHSCFPTVWPATPPAPTASVEVGVGELSVRPSARAPGVDLVRVRAELYHPSLGQYGTRTERTVSASQTVVTLPDLIPNRTYRVLVSFHNAAGWSAWSPPVTSVVGLMPTAPAFRYLESSHTTIGFGWSRGDNGDANYDVTIRRAVDGKWGESSTFRVPGTDLHYRFRELLPATKYLVSVRATNAFGASSWSTGQAIMTLGCSSSCAEDPPTFMPLPPQRFADSRDAPTFDGAYSATGRRSAGSIWEILIAGRGGVPREAEAAIVNLTALNADGVGYATVYPCGAVPVASSLNYAPGTVEPNEVIAQLSDRGTVCVYTKRAVDLVVDVVGHVTNSPYQPLSPRRIADSRSGPTVDGKFRNTGVRRGGTVWEIRVAGRGSVPASARTAALNLTTTGAPQRGYATVYPCGERPAASAINFGAGVRRANELVTTMSDVGTVCIYVNTDVHVIVDVVGYTSDVTTLTMMRPVRIADSRREPTIDGAFRDTGIRRGGTTWSIQVDGRAGVRNADAAIANITVTGASTTGYATVYPCGPLPIASTLNYGAGTTRANETITELSDEGHLCVYTSADVHILVDVVGFTHP